MTSQCASVSSMPVRRGDHRRAPRRGNRVRAGSPHCPSRARPLQPMYRHRHASVHVPSDRFGSLAPPARHAVGGDDRLRRDEHPPAQPALAADAHALDRAASRPATSPCSVSAKPTIVALAGARLARRRPEMNRAVDRQRVEQPPRPSASNSARVAAPSLATRCADSVALGRSGRGLPAPTRSRLPPTSSSASCSAQARRAAAPRAAAAPAWRAARAARRHRPSGRRAADGSRRAARPRATAVARSIACSSGHALSAGRLVPATSNTTSTTSRIGFRHGLRCIRFRRRRSGAGSAGRSRAASPPSAASPRPTPGRSPDRCRRS